MAKILQNYMYRRLGKIKQDKKHQSKIAKMMKKREDWLSIRQSSMDSLREGKGDAAALVQEMHKAAKKLVKTAKYSKTRYRKRCVLTNRSRGLKLGVARHTLFINFGFGHVNGSKKAS